MVNLVDGFLLFQIVRKREQEALLGADVAVVRLKSSNQIDGISHFTRNGNHSLIGSLA